MKLPEIPEEPKLLTGKDILIRMVQAKEQFLSMYRIDNFNVTRRREGSRIKHLGSTDLTKSTKETLKQFYLHLTKKHMEVL